MSHVNLSDAASSRALRALLGRVDDTLASVDGFPFIVDPDTGVWETTEDGNWCAGHWIGLLWLAYAHADGIMEQVRYESAAWTCTEILRDAMPRSNVFCPMNFRYAGFRGYDTIGDRRLFALGLEGADAMVRLFNERERLIPLGEYPVRGPSEQFGPQQITGRSPRTNISAVDAVYTALPSLWRAYAETNDPRFRDIAVSHADRHLDRFFRDNGSTWHKFEFGTGRTYNDLAHSMETCWARGLGWHVAGLARAVTETGAERYLDTLERSVEYYLDTAPDDLVPYWDFETPRRPNAPKDTSAAALVAYGLTRLGGNGERIETLRAVGEDVLTSIVIDYLHTDESDPRYGAVEHGCYNKPGEYGVDTEQVWTNYYVAYALHTLVETNG